MSKKYARVIRIDFDSMENHISEAILTKELVLFGDDEKESASSKAKKFIETYELEPKARGWDGKEYPRLEVEEGELR
jgi:hypothetical protein